MQILKTILLFAILTGVTGMAFAGNKMDPRVMALLGSDDEKNSAPQDQHVAPQPARNPIQQEDASSPVPLEKSEVNRPIAQPVLAVRKPTGPKVSTNIPGEHSSESGNQPANLSGDGNKPSAHAMQQTSAHLIQQPVERQRSKHKKPEKSSPITEQTTASGHVIPGVSDAEFDKIPQLNFMKDIEQRRVKLLESVVARLKLEQEVRELNYALKQPVQTKKKPDDPKKEPFVGGPMEPMPVADKSPAGLPRVMPMHRAPGHKKSSFSPENDIELKRVEWLNNSLQATILYRGKRFDLKKGDRFKKWTVSRVDPSFIALKKGRTESRVYYSSADENDSPKPALMGIDAAPPMGPADRSSVLTFPRVSLPGS